MRKKEGLEVCFESPGMVFQPSAERLFRRKQPEKGSVSVGV